LLLVGPPAAGKSSFAQAMADIGLIGEAAIVSCDAIREEIFGPDADPETADPQVFAHMDQLVRQRLNDGLTVVVDATNVTSQARQRMIKWAMDAGRPVWVARFPVDLNALLYQNAHRSKILPASMVTHYAELMDGSATAEHLLAEGIDVVIDVPGSRENLLPQEAARRVFSRPWLSRQISSLPAVEPEKPPTA
jgi:predicted kinase